VPEARVERLEVAVNVGEDRDDHLRRLRRSTGI